MSSKRDESLAIDTGLRMGTGCEFEIRSPNCTSNCTYLGRYCAAATMFIKQSKSPSGVSTGIFLVTDTNPLAFLGVCASGELSSPLFPPHTKSSPSSALFPTFRASHFLIPNRPPSDKAHCCLSVVDKPWHIDTRRHGGESRATLPHTVAAAKNSWRHHRLLSELKSIIVTTVVIAGQSEDSLFL